ncbi:MAG: cupin domain-containing protein [Acidimicrobiia bacterium]|jgi:mannose-6-phosphate isomerase-like protein (cupin superfamily)
MDAAIVRPDPGAELSTEERCSILESWNDASDAAVSIARARVAPGVTTALHRVDVHERYVIVAGQGVASVGDLPPAEVGPGDVVLIPAGVPQRIANPGDTDLLFYCVCTPRFRPEGYESLEERA